MPAVSVMIITFNEAENIGRLIENVRSWASEILIIDSGSADNTVEIAEKLGAKVLFHPFEGYGAQKQYGTNMATYDWVLSLDADEMPDARLTLALQNFVFTKQSAENIAYNLYRTLVFLNKPMKYTREHKQALTRLFDRRHAHFSNSIIHEKILVNEKKKIGCLDGELWHFSYQNISHYLQKFDGYTSKWANQAAAQNKKTALFQLYFRFWIEFFKIYLLNRFCLNGWRGLLWALLSGLYPVIKYAKLKEKTK